MMSAMPVAAILGAAGVNNTHGNYHYSDGPKCAHDYNDVPFHCYCALL
jgi:hypothetical protein